MTKSLEMHIFEKLQEAKWNTYDASQLIKEYIIDLDYSNISLKFIEKNKIFIDYALKNSQGFIIALIFKLNEQTFSQKDTIISELVAKKIEKSQGFRPFIYFINNHSIGFWDSINYPIRKVLSFHSIDDLEKMRIRNNKAIILSSKQHNKFIAGRPYQCDAIYHTLIHLNNKHRSALWEMATGTGKTRTAIALVDILLKQGFITNVLFLVDRIELASQAINSFEKYLPHYSRQKIKSEQYKKNRKIYVCTYQKMKLLIDKSYISQGFFDFIIADESHRSIYKYFGQIFLKFDAIKLGLTATPIKFIDRNTFSLFETKNDAPTFSYPYEKAIKEKYLCPFNAKKLHIQNGNFTFSQNINNVSSENLTFISHNDYLEILLAFLKDCYYLPHSNLPAKTIFFVSNKKNAFLLEELFTRFFPDGCAKAIVSGRKNNNELLKEFLDETSKLNIAISVDILSTGVDIPSLMNIVLATRIKSNVTLRQIIGRGSRPYMNLFEKKEFYIFDLFENIKNYYNSNNDQANISRSLPRKLFNITVNLYNNVIHSDERIALEKDILAQISTLPTDDLFIQMHKPILQKCIDYKKKTINQSSLGNISIFFDRVRVKNPSEYNIKIYIRLLQYSQSVKNSQLKNTSIAKILRLIPSLQLDREFKTLIEDYIFWESADFCTATHIMNKLTDFLSKNKAE